MAIIITVLMQPGNMVLNINLGGEDILQGVGVFAVVVGVIFLAVWKGGGSGNNN